MLYPIHLASADGDKQQMLLGTSDMHGLGAYMKHDMKGPTVYPEEIIMRDVFHRVTSEFAKLRALRLRNLPIIETPYAP